MSDKAIIGLTVTIGTIAGSYLPALWGAGFLSGWSVLLAGVGGIAGIWVGYHLIHG